MLRCRQAWCSCAVRSSAVPRPGRRTHGYAAGAVPQDGWWSRRCRPRARSAHYSCQRLPTTPVSSSAADAMRPTQCRRVGGDRGEARQARHPLSPRARSTGSGELSPNTSPRLIRSVTDGSSTLSKPRRHLFCGSRLALRAMRRHEDCSAFIAPVSCVGFGRRRRRRTSVRCRYGLRCRPTARDQSSAGKPTHPAPALSTSSIVASPRMTSLSYTSGMIRRALLTRQRPDKRHRIAGHRGIVQKLLEGSLYRR
jgi:hypothetical protein